MKFRICTGGLARSSGVKFKLGVSKDRERQGAEYQCFNVSNVSNVSNVFPKCISTVACSRRQGLLPRDNELSSSPREKKAFFLA